MANQERWQVSNTAALRYEQFVASWFVPWAVDLVERAGLQPGWSVLDVACGTGVVTRAAAPLIGATGEIVATDLNEGMLAEAKRHSVDGAPVRWRNADASDLPFETGRFDAVLCQQGLQFVPDRATAVAEMRRVLRSGGVAAASVWCGLDENPYMAALADGLRHHLSAEAAQTMAAPCAFGDRDEFLQLFADAGFAQVQVDVVERYRLPRLAVEAIEGNFAALPVADQIEAMAPADRAAMINDVVAALDEFIDRDMLTVPATAHIVVATV